MRFVSSNARFLGQEKKGIENLHTVAKDQCSSIPLFADQTERISTLALLYFKTKSVRPEISRCAISLNEKKKE